MYACPVYMSPAAYSCPRIGELMESLDEVERSRMSAIAGAQMPHTCAGRHDCICVKQPPHSIAPADAVGIMNNK
jgi:hypothetical protein